MNSYNGKAGQRSLLSGLFAATFVPFAPNGAINPDAIPDYADFLVENGVKSIFVNGIEEEYKTLTTEERREITEAWMWIASRLEHIVVHVGDDCQKVSIDLAQHAECLGVDAVCSSAPSHTTLNEDELVSFLSPIAQAANDVSFYYFHSKTSCSVDLEEICRKAKAAIPNFCGVIFSEDNFPEAFHLRINTGLDVVCFHDRDIICQASLGFTAYISPSLNFNGSLYQNVLDITVSSKLVKAAIGECQEVQRKLNTMHSIAIRYGHGVAGMREIFRIAAQDIGIPRAPSKQVSQGDRAAMERELRDV